MTYERAMTRNENGNGGGSGVAGGGARQRQRGRPREGGGRGGEERQKQARSAATKDDKYGNIKNKGKGNDKEKEKAGKNGDGNDVSSSQLDQRRRYYATRVCIRNLPSEATERELRDFLTKSFADVVVVAASASASTSGARATASDSSPLRITDCRLLPSSSGDRQQQRKKQLGHRRSGPHQRGVAFVGVADPQQCQLLIDKFHRSYYKSKRLIVERAYHYDDESNNKKQQQQEDDENGSDDDDDDDGKNRAHRRHLEREQEKEEEERRLKELRKKREFLAVMGVAVAGDGDAAARGGTSAAAPKSSPPVGKKNKFWSNDDGGDGDALLFDAVAAKAVQRGDDDDDDSVSSATTSTASSDDEDDADPLTTLVSRKKTTANVNTNDNNNNNTIMSDMDFLRSKQVKADELEDEEEMETSAAGQGSVAGAAATVPQDGEGRQKEKENDDSADSSGSSDSSSDDGESSKDSSSRNNETNENHASGNDSKSTQGVSNTTTSRTRLFVRNLPFTATEEDVQEFFADTYNLTVTECHLPVDDLKRPKGFGFLTFGAAQDAQRALREVDGSDFQGRLMHLMPAKENPAAPDAAAKGGTDGDGSAKNLTYKQRLEQRRREQANNPTGWSASFVRGDAVVDTLADRLGLRKGDILAVRDGLSSGDAAVRLALGETAVIGENRNYFAEHGIDMEALVSVKRANENEADGSSSKPSDKAIERSKTSILVKNLPADTTQEELMKVFGGVGETPSRILLPPSRTIAVVEYRHGNDAKGAFRRLAYRRFKSVPLYLEWAPLAARVTKHTKSTNHESQQQDSSTDQKDALADTIEDVNDVADVVSSGPTSAVYVRNLNFKTSEDELRKFFSKHVDDVRAVRVPQKAVPIKRVRGAAAASDEGAKMHSMGYGFVEFGSQESAKTVLRTLQGALLDGHALQLAPSKNGNSSANANAFEGIGSDQQKQQQQSKLMVRNVPFQASRTELLKLFGSFGQLRRVRLPKKFDGSHRGFAFVEYLSGKDASAAMKSLSRTHLYGRHLVIEWAAPDEDEDDVGKLREKAGRQGRAVLAAAAAADPPKNKKIRFE